MIKIGNKTTGINNGSSTLTIAHTVANNADRILIVSVMARDTNATKRSVSGITFNGVALTSIRSAEIGSCKHEVWYLLAPSVGTFNVVITMGGSPVSLCGGVVDIYDAEQTTPEANNGQGLLSDTATTNVTTLSGNALLFSSAQLENSTGTVTHGTNQTDLFNIANGVANIIGSASYKEAPTAGSQSMQETLTGSTRIAHNVVAFRAKQSVSVTDNVAVAENVSVLSQEIYLSVFDTVSISEQVFAYLDVLNISVLDPFHVLITEHAEILDLIIELGVVMEATYVSDVVSVYLDVLNVNQYDDILETEFIYVYLITLNVSVSDDSITIQTAVSLFLDYLFIYVADDIVVAEDLEIWKQSEDVDEHEHISLNEEASVSLDVLNVNVLDPFHVVITEHAQIIDLVIELGIVMEAVSVGADYISIYIDVLNIFSDESILIVEVASVLLGDSEISVSDDVATEEEASLYVWILATAYDTSTVDEDVSVALSEKQVTATDDVLTQEVAVVSLDYLFIDVYETDILIAEDVDLHPDPIWFDLYDDISVSENVSCQLDSLNLNVQDEWGVLVTEHADVIDETYEVGVIDSKIYVSESVYLYLDVLVPFAPDMPYTLPQHKVDEWVNISVILNVLAGDWITPSDYADVDVRIALSVSDIINAQETASIYRDPQFSVSDTATISEDITISQSSAPVTFSVNVYDLLTCFDVSTVKLEELFISVSDQITVLEHISTQDIIIELEVNEAVAVSEVVNLTVQSGAQLSISVNDSVLYMGGFVTLGLDPLQIARSEVISVSDYGNVFDNVVEMEAIDIATISEYVQWQTVFIYYDLTVDDSVVISEFADTAPAWLDIIDLYEDVLVTDVAVAEFTGALISLFAFDNVTKAEAVSAVVFYIAGDISVSLAQNITVTEMAYLVAEGFIPRPPIIFDFHRYPTNAIVFEYESRTITLPY